MRTPAGHLAPLSGLVPVPEVSAGGSHAVVVYMGVGRAGQLQLAAQLTCTLTSVRLLTSHRLTFTIDCCHTHPSSNHRQHSPAWKPCAVELTLRQLSTCIWLSICTWDMPNVTEQLSRERAIAEGSVRVSTVRSRQRATGGNVCDSALETCLFALVRRRQRSRGRRRREWTCTWRCRSAWPPTRRRRPGSPPCCCPRRRPPSGPRIRTELRRCRCSHGDSPGAATGAACRGGLPADGCCAGHGALRGELLTRLSGMLGGPRCCPWANLL